jgi:glycine/D-amino acid oxidase-like deaminating enzyme/nitrite reductase/ring-hydroxylating ferredoxin subunit
MNENQSIWAKDLEMVHFMPLHRDVDSDVCIIGGGIAGIMTAYLLQKEGKKICLVEDQELGSGQSGKSTAHFTVALDRPYFDLEAIHGSDGIQKIAQSHQAAIQLIKDIVFQENLSCDLETVNGTLFTTQKSKDRVEKELQSIHRAGIENAHLDAHTALPFQTEASITFPNQVQLNPLKLIKNLAEIIQFRGGKIFTHTHANEIHGGSKPHVITNDGYRVAAKSIVVATNTPIHNRISVHLRQIPRRTYVVSALIPTGSVGKGLYWNTLEDQHYLSIRSHDQENDLLVIGGEGHRTGQESETEQNYERLETWAREHFPVIRNFQHRWSGQIHDSIDGIGHLGHNPFDQKNISIITGDSGNGMTNSIIGAMIITDQIMERSNPWSEIYSPSRLKLKSIPDYIQENIKTASQYADWFKEKSFDELEQIPEGHGAVLRKGIRMIAAYKDQNGNVDLHSAVCPHLGGIVQWNASEKSWDCPCHGSRFDCHGTVMEGPANRNLRPIRKSTLVPTPFVKKPKPSEKKQPTTPGANA